MTKLEELLSYRSYPYNALDSWWALGKQKIVAKGISVNNTRFFNEGSIYLLESEGELSYSLIYCISTYIDEGLQLKWNSVELLDYEKGYLSFGNDIISPNFRLILLPVDVMLCAGSDPENYVQKTPGFVPFKDLKSTQNIIISDADYEEILTSIGGPFIKEEELEYTRDQICNLAIKPGLREYFHWIPATRPQIVQVTTQKQDVDMPSDAYACCGLSLQQTGGSLTGNMTTPFAYAYMQSLYGGMSGMLGIASNVGNKPMTDLNGGTSVFERRAAQQAIVNYNRRVHYEGPYKKSNGSRYITIYSNTQGEFNVWWAIHSLDFNDVEFAERTRVIEYCQACVKELFANIRSQARSDIPGQYNYETWKKEAYDVKERIKGEWREIVKANGILRGSL